MKLVVDTNVLFTFFWKKSVTRQLFRNLELFSPEFALEEINLHKPEILDKTELSEAEFRHIKIELAIAVSFIPLEEYEDKFEHAKKISPDTKDTDFIALALKLKLPLWSNDVSLKGQRDVKVLSTSDVIDELLA